MRRLTLELRLLFVALQFLTRVPTPRWVGFEPDWLNRSARYFSLVGSLVGVVAAAVLWAASLLFPPVVAVLLSMTATLLLTGGFHEDGLADTWDALGGAVDRERALAIMKDSRIGSYGALALWAVLGLKAAALTALAGAGLASVIPALLLAHTASRAAAVTLIRVLPYAGDLAHAKAKPLARSISSVEVAASIGWALMFAAGLVAQNPVHANHAGMALLLTAAGTGWSVRWLRARLGGYTGDTLGATQQLTELAMLLGWLAVSRWPA